MGRDRDSRRTADDNETSHKHTRKSSSRHHHRHHSSRRERERESRRHHHHNHHHHRSSGHRDKDTSRRTSGTTNTDVKRESTKRATKTNRQGPSSSIGPGRVEAVLLVILILLGISAAVLISLSIWLYAVRNGWPSGLNQTGSITWTRLISYATAALLVGILFIPIIIIAVAAALTRVGSSARRLRLSLVLLTSAASVILLMMTVTALLFATSGTPFISNALEQSWKNTVTSRNYLVACHVQNVNSCFGWFDNSCVGCRPTVQGNYSGCSAQQVSVCPRCYTSTTSTRNSKNNNSKNNGIITSITLPVNAMSAMSNAMQNSEKKEITNHERVNQQRLLLSIEAEREATAAATTTPTFGLMIERVRKHVIEMRSSLKDWWTRLVRRDENKSTVDTGNIKKQRRWSSSSSSTAQRQTNNNQQAEPGCFRYVIWRNREFFIPMAVYTIFLILLLNLLAWKACIDSSGRY